MPPIPQDSSPESSPALLRDGYTFISKRCHRYHADLFQARLLLMANSVQPVICMRGAEAAKVFYDTDRFQRHGAASPRVLKTLFGEDGVQTMDGEAHRWRKQLFMSLMAPEGIERLADMTTNEWRASIDKWRRRDTVTLFPEVQRILCRAVCQWSGVPLEEQDVKRRTDEFAAMIDGPASLGPRHWRGRLARRRSERWIRDLIEQVRTHKRDVAEGSALHAIAWHRTLDGQLLDSQVASVELINVLRPTVAIARFITFAAVALYEHPECRQQIQAGDQAYRKWFVQEVRRFYPFFPFVGSRVRQRFDWNGYHFPSGRLVLLDLYGTNHDERLWETPQVFQPERFRDWEGDPFTLIPQGGGDYYENHRCPGEWITIELMMVAAQTLTTSMHYEVPPQDLHIDLSRMPAIPKSHFVISDVQRVQ